MYIPPHFREDRLDVIHEIMRRYSFATLVSQHEGPLIASQLPFLFDAGRNVLRSHMARPNPQWKELGEREVMVLFEGPHAYVSPSWYESKLLVPTWNYVTVHAYGHARLIEDGSELRAIVADTVRLHESGREKPWQMDLPQEQLSKLLRGIVGFEITISRLEGKLKLNQNRSRADVEGVIAGLTADGNAANEDLAAWMRRMVNAAIS